MSIFNTIISSIFDILFYPFSGLHPVWGLIFISVVTGVLMLLIFKITSNQTGIKKTKSHIQAYLLELRLFQHDARLSMQAFRNVLKSNMKYLGYALKPMVFLIVPVLLVMIQLAVRYEFQSLSEGDSTILNVRLSDGVSYTDVELEPDEGIRVETPALRIPGENQIYWRIRAVSEGEWQVRFKYMDDMLQKPVFVQSDQTKISPKRLKGTSVHALLYPAEPVLPGNGFLQEISLQYPHQSMAVFGLTVHWFILFFVLTIVVGFAFKGIFKVEI